MMTPRKTTAKRSDSSRKTLNSYCRCPAKRHCSSRRQRLSSAFATSFCVARFCQKGLRAPHGHPACGRLSEVRSRVAEDLREARRQCTHTPLVPHNRKVPSWNGPTQPQEEPTILMSQSCLHTRRQLRSYPAPADWQVSPPENLCHDPKSEYSAHQWARVEEYHTLLHIQK